MIVSWRRVGYVAVVAVAVAFAVVPLLWMVSTSLKSNREITQDGTLIPDSFTFANYASLFNGREFGAYLTNSIVVTAVSVAIALLFGTHAAYAVARFRLWRGMERYVGLALLVTRIVPPIVIIIPVFLLAQGFGVLNSKLGLIVMYSAFNVSVVVWMMESFFREIPIDLEEAAMVDGAGAWRTFVDHTLPMLRPTILVAVTLRSIDALTTFDQVYVLTRGGPGTATQLVSIYGYQTFFQFQQFGYAAALLIMVALVVIAAAGLAVGLMRRRR